MDVVLFETSFNNLHCPTSPITSASGPSIKEVRTALSINLAPFSLVDPGELRSQKYVAGRFCHGRSFFGWSLQPSP